MNPATGECIGVLPHASKADLDRALDAAEQAYPVWRGMSPQDRGKILKRAADLMHERAEHIARIATIEEGKTIHETRLETHGSADILEWYAEEGRRAYGRVLPQRTPGVRMTVLREPVGPVAAFAPWNFPVGNPCRKLGAALAAGCPVHHEAGRAYAGIGARSGARADGRRAAERRDVDRFRRAVAGLHASSGVAGDPKGLVHRIHASGQATHEAGGRRHEAHHHGAGRPRAGDRVRRRGCGPRARSFGRVQVPQFRPGVRFADALLRARKDLQAIRRWIRGARQFLGGRRWTGRDQQNGTAGAFAALELRWRSC